MKTEVQSGGSAMLNWGQKVYPTNIRLCAWNTSVINSHTIPICGQHDYSPNYKKNTLSSLEVRQLLFSLYATPVCHRAPCQGLRHHLQAVGDAGISWAPSTSVRTAPPEPSSGDWLPSPILEAFTATCRLSAKKKENKSRFKQELYREAA